MPSDERLQQLFNPEGLHRSTEEALSSRLSMLAAIHRSEIGDPRLTDTVAAEALHMGGELSPQQRSALGLSALRAIEIQSELDKGVERDIDFTFELVQTIRDKCAESSDLSDTVLAGMVASELAHLGVNRKNGKEYYTHPAEVARIIETAWDRHVPIQQYQMRKERLVFLAYTHDTFEDSQKKDGSSFVSQNNFLVTPRYVEKLFARLGRSDGSLASHSLLALTKTRQAGSKIPLSRYVENIKHDPDATLIKLADIQHNHILDPKGRTDLEKTAIARNLQRASNYRDTQLDLLFALEEGSPIDRWIGHSIHAMAHRDLNNLRKSSAYIRPIHYIGTPDDARHA